MNHYKMKAEGGHVGARVGRAPVLVAELSIRVMNDGTIQITGPLNNKDLCLRVLAAAKEQIEQAEASQLVSSN